MDDRQIRRHQGGRVYLSLQQARDAQRELVRVHRLQLASQVRAGLVVLEDLRQVLQLVPGTEDPVEAAGK
ncbi:hypothetical protein DQ392_11740 [Streptomyces reniochalinae]|uniref:Uncharacterized protein n=1 Tax=Streptomyces reniochalinae TaxID=2250578 RepID=A0A367EMI2_9ACTN|nr:hypothetical protein DQ392_11740 [Streptomyces reniochalinae]